MSDLDFSRLDRNVKGLYVPKQLISGAKQKAFFGGTYHARHIRNGKVIDEWDFDNLIVNEGLDYILAASLTGGSVLTSWYLGIFEGNYTPVATDTAASIAANSTECTAYSQPARVIWTGVEGSQAATNAASVATFTFNATKTIFGAFLVSASAKNATTGKMVSAAAFGASKSVVSTDQLLLTYAFAASSV